MIIRLTKRTYIKQSLQLNYGIGSITANKIIGCFHLRPTAPYKLLQRKKYKFYISQILPKLRIGFRLRLIVFSRMCLLISIDTYRGLRMIQGLPTRGQRTHANGKTPKALHKQLSFFPFRLQFKHKQSKSSLRQEKKNNKNNRNNKKIIPGKKKVTSKQKAKIKAKNKAKAKAKKKANK